MTNTKPYEHVYPQSTLVQCGGDHQPGCDCAVAEEDVARSKPPLANSKTRPLSTLGALQTIQFPKPAAWQVRLTPGGNVTFRPTEGNVPCWFHRQMQRLWFGFVWERVK